MSDNNINNEIVKNQCPNKNQCKTYNKKCKNKQNENCEKSNSKCSIDSIDTKNNIKKLDLRLYEFSYADYILLSSTIAYAISENVNDPDIDILISFFGMITSDLAILRTRKGIINGLAIAAKNSASNDAIIDNIESIQASEEISGNLLRKQRTDKKHKKYKKRKVRKIKSNV